MSVFSQASERGSEEWQGYITLDLQLQQERAYIAKLGPDAYILGYLSPNLGRRGKRAEVLVVIALYSCQESVSLLHRMHQQTDFTFLFFAGSVVLATSLGISCTVGNMEWDWSRVGGKCLPDS